MSSKPRDIAAHHGDAIDQCYSVQSGPPAGGPATPLAVPVLQRRNTSLQEPGTPKVVALRARDSPAHRNGLRMSSSGQRSHFPF
jgi:hypothetical protein